MAKAPDYSAFHDAHSDTNLLTLISDKADELKQKQEEFDAAEKALADLKHEIFVLETRTLPELMERGKLTSFKTRSGSKIAIKEDIRASLSKERKEEGLKWLRDRGHDAIIKTMVVNEFGVGEDADAVALLEELRQRNSLHPRLESNIHYMTLQSFIKGLVTKGVEVDMDLFNVSRLMVAKVS